eukprot:305125-Pyramimonas_sp.AAC.1
MGGVVGLKLRDDFTVDSSLPPSLSSLSPSSPQQSIGSSSSSFLPHPVFLSSFLPLSKIHSPPRNAFNITLRGAPEDSTEAATP